VHKYDLLEWAIEQTATDPAGAIMIGDRSHDIVGAKKNGMDGIGVLYGYGSREELLEAGAVHLCATPRAILDHLAADSGTA
jgi:phosphoglycolate phosphatase